MTFEELAQSLSALEQVDASPFQRRARVLQALWRTERGYASGEQRTNGGTRLMAEGDEPSDYDND